MKLKKAILDVMSRDELKAVVDGLGLEGVDRRRADDTASRLSRARSATPELLLEGLSEVQVKAVCEAVGLSSIGRKGALVEMLLAVAKGGNGDDAEAPELKLEGERVAAAAERPAKPPRNPLASLRLGRRRSVPRDGMHQLWWSRRRGPTPSLRRDASTPKDCSLTCKGAIASIYAAWKKDYHEWASSLDFGVFPSPVLLCIADNATAAPA